MSTLSFDETLDKIKTILAENSGITKMKVEDINQETLVFGHGGVIIDSLNILDALTGIESEFDFEIPDEDLNEELFSSVSELANYVYKNRICNDD